MSVATETFQGTSSFEIAEFVPQEEVFAIGNLAVSGIEEEDMVLDVTATPYSSLESAAVMADSNNGSSGSGSCSHSSSGQVRLA